METTRRELLSRFRSWSWVSFLWFGFSRNRSEVLAQSDEARFDLEEQTAKFESFELSALEKSRQAKKRPYLPFLERKSLSCGLYALPRGSRDRQSPHDRDEVYSILEGSAVLEVEKGNVERIPVKQGSVVFVAARIPHRFVEIEKDLKVLVFFGGKL